MWELIIIETKNQSPILMKTAFRPVPWRYVLAGLTCSSSWHFQAQAEAPLLQPIVLVQTDFGRSTSDQNEANIRRARLGAFVNIHPDIDFEGQWEFAGGRGDSGGLLIAQMRVRPTDLVQVSFGRIEPHLSLQIDRDASEVLFLERSAVSEILSQLVPDDGLELRLRRTHWFASAAYLTEIGANQGGEDRSALTWRIAASPAAGKARVHLALSGIRSRLNAGQVSPRTGLTSRAEQALAQGPTLEAEPTPSGSNMVISGEFAIAADRLLVQAETSSDQERGSTGSGQFAGWYAQAAYTLRGKPPQYVSNHATWKYDQEAGAIDLAFRHSKLNFAGSKNDSKLHVLSFVGRWRPAKAVALFVEAQRITLLQADERTSGNALVARLQVTR